MRVNMRNILCSAAATLVLASPVSSAALLDFTDMDVLNSLSKSGSGSSTTYSGTIDNVAFTLSSTGGVLQKHKDSKYDGSSYIGCQSTGGPLKCDKDGLGVDNDEISGYKKNKETITISFSKPVTISEFYFLDLYKGKKKEKASVKINDITYHLKASASSGDGGFGLLSLIQPLTTDKIVFSAKKFKGDDGNNDYAVAGLSLTPVPLPAAAWLFVSGLAGLAWLRRRKFANA